MMNTISILGSTGSIGRQTLDVAEQLGLRVAALTANSNVERMEAQCRKFRPRLAVMTEEAVFSSPWPLRLPAGWFSRRIPATARGPRLPDPSVL